ncbi:MAG: DUF3313 domain-containing protein [Phycisphaera sp.]|nr:DUF3313 domain-containing protein [Phycisphaera sp.]
MRIPLIIPAFLLSGIALLGGCASDYKVSPSGFLTGETYASLEEGEAREQLVTWTNEDVDVADYDAFLVDPIELRLDDDADARNISSERMTELSEYFHGQVVDFLGGSHRIVTEPDHGVLRVRIAVTDVKKATVLLNIHPATSISRLGLGAAAMETEVSDARSGEVVFAMMGGRKGGPFGLEKLDPWGHAKQAMDIWAEHLAENIAPVASG